MIHVLLVDDENILLDTISIYLSGKEQISSEVCYSATDALDVLKVKKFDVIVSDYDMPEMNGIEFLKKLRSNGNDIPFILFTGRGREEVAIDALNNGADYYIQKSGDVKVLFTELSSSIRKSAEKYEAYKKVKHLNDIIVTIRRVKRLKEEEQDFSAYLRLMCAAITESSSYENSRIVLFTKPGDIIAAEQSGFGEEFESVLEWLSGGELTGCAKKAIANPGVIVSERCGIECEGCPFKFIHSHFGSITCRLEREDVIYGILSVSLPRDLVGDKDEHLLFEILARDISKAIHTFSLKENNLSQQVIISAKNKRHCIDNVVFHSIFNETRNIAEILEKIGKSSGDNPVLLENVDRANASLKHVEYELRFTRNYQDMGKVTPEWHDLRELTIAKYNCLKQKGLKLEVFNDNLLLFADNMIERVIEDIVGFLIKNRQNARTLRVSYAETAENCCIAFEDDGEGVPYSAKEKIFEKDYRDSNGAGLYLSREILGITGISVNECGDYGYGTHIRLIVPKGCYRINEMNALPMSPGTAK